MARKNSAIRFACSFSETIGLLQYYKTESRILRCHFDTLSLRENLIDNQTSIFGEVKRKLNSRLLGRLGPEGNARTGLQRFLINTVCITFNGRKKPIFHEKCRSLSFTLGVETTIVTRGLKQINSFNSGIEVTPLWQNNF